MEDILEQLKNEIDSIDLDFEFKVDNVVEFKEKEVNIKPIKKCERIIVSYTWAPNTIVFHKTFATLADRIRCRTLLEPVLDCLVNTSYVIHDFLTIKYNTGFTTVFLLEEDSRFYTKRIISNNDGVVINQTLVQSVDLPFNITIGEP